MTKWRLDKGQIEVVDEAIADVLRRKTPVERLEMAFAANRTVRLVIEGNVLTNHPNWDSRQVTREVARRMLLGSGTTIEDHHRSA